ncbi:MAG: lytic transglycosylase domain-containing protein [Alphaproteobacteria bacterium]|uniref:lytic transglycosylase domain-containing protein n=1 Tax=Brevundimonas sp. BAL3 TaxID=391600 RepID=UPI00017ED0F7|nr:lytic transglycosylase domain-containing protein [Brevundimonas sp. BAL3]EDX79996.1 Transglycosylase SLT domain protein [Brevundimonas sp. BAL3]PZN97825.1 MAG: lytic transglycosylase domain-containing protein [Alphaproteobacteria bacterium]
MVRRTLITLAALLSASTASAQIADWRAAGGDLFAAIDTVEPVAEPSAEEPLDTPRLAPLSQPFMAAIAAAAERHGLDPKLLHALVVVESAYRNEACSPVGACGLAQLMPGTAAELGVRDRFDPAENLSGGAAYLARQMLRFGDLRLALAAYNAGPGRVARLGRIPDIRETQEYVVSVVDCYLALTAGRGVHSSRECRTGAGQ